MTRPREARKGGVWIVEIHLVDGWMLAAGSGAFSSKEAATHQSVKFATTRGNEYRARRYVPANPRRSTRRKRK